VRRRSDPEGAPQPSRDVGSVGSAYDTLYRVAPPGGTLSARRGWPTNRLEALIFFARPGGRLLEIGCGEGSVIYTLRQQFSECYGIELSEVRANRARELLNPYQSCHITAESVEEFSERVSGSLQFDCIVWADVIEHVIDVMAAFKAIQRIAAPNAQLITTTPNIGFLQHRLRLLSGRFPSTSLPYHRSEGFMEPGRDTVLLDGGHVHYFTYRMVRRLYEIWGFNSLESYGFGRRLSRLRNLYPSMLSGNVCVVGYRDEASDSDNDPR
jgi:2-polyprenyl-3-methyl-5-hydroxy-6-metoxy-1,4-benzoquinol methylase